jgi:O-antigen ligase
MKRLTVGELIILAGISLLFLEIIKASRSRRAGVDHALSMVLFVVALLEFLLVPACGTSGFLIITALALIDVIAGFAVSLSTARRDIAIS